jgi:hypothetical protein
VAGGDVAGLFAWLSKPYRFALWILYHIDLRFFTAHNTGEQSYGGIVGFVLRVKW